MPTLRSLLGISRIARQSAAGDVAAFPSRRRLEISGCTISDNPRRERTEVQARDAVAGSIALHATVEGPDYFDASRDDWFGGSAAFQTAADIYVTCHGGADIAGLALLLAPSGTACRKILLNLGPDALYLVPSDIEGGFCTDNHDSLTLEAGEGVRLVYDPDQQLWWIGGRKFLHELENVFVEEIDNPVIDHAARTVQFYIPEGSIEAPITAIAPFFEVSAGASVEPTAPQDFSSGPVTYTITGGDGRSADWLISCELIAPRLDVIAMEGIYSASRSLISSHVGSALFRVTRASDNAQLVVNSLPNGECDVDALEAFCAGTDGYVNTLYDQAGNRPLQGAGVPNWSPRVVIDGVVQKRGRDVVMVFDGDDYFLSSAFGTWALTGNPAFTVAALWQPTITASASALRLVPTVSGSSVGFGQKPSGGLAMARIGVGASFAAEMIGVGFGSYEVSEYHSLLMCTLSGSALTDALVERNGSIQDYSAGSAVNPTGQPSMGTSRIRLGEGLVGALGSVVFRKGLTMPSSDELAVLRRWLAYSV